MVHIKHKRKRQLGDLVVSVQLVVWETVNVLYCLTTHLYIQSMCVHWIAGCLQIWVTGQCVTVALCTQVGMENSRVWMTHTCVCNISNQRDYLPSAEPDSTKYTLVWLLHNSIIWHENSNDYVHRDMVSLVILLHEGQGILVTLSDQTIFHYHTDNFKVRVVQYFTMSILNSHKWPALDPALSSTIAALTRWMALITKLSE